MRANLQSVGSVCAVLGLVLLLAPPGQAQSRRVNTSSITQYMKKYAEMEQAAYKAAMAQAQAEEQALAAKRQAGKDKAKARKELEKQKGKEWAEKQKAKREADKLKAGGTSVADAKSKSKSTAKPGDKADAKSVEDAKSADAKASDAKVDDEKSDKSSEVAEEGDKTVKPTELKPADKPVATATTAKPPVKFKK